MTECDVKIGVLVSGTGDRYEGGWLNNRYEGKGSMLYANGDRYEGMWSNGKQEGKGVMTYANGDRYEGFWLVEISMKFHLISRVEWKA